MNTSTHDVVQVAPATGPRPRIRRLLALPGFLVPVLAYVGVHELHPDGQIEQMSDAEIAAWAASGAHEIWFGGATQLAAGLLLLVFGAVVGDLLDRSRASDLSRRLSWGSFQLSAAVLAVAAFLQVMAGVVATPEESFESATFLPVVVLLYGNLNVALWCLLAPAAAAMALAPAASRWLRTFSAILAVLLLLTVALPFVSWGPAFLWLTMAAGAIAFGRDR